MAKHAATRSFFPFLTLAAMIAFGSCKKDPPPTAPPSGGGGASGTPVSPAQRRAAIDRVEHAFASVDWHNPAAAKQSLLQTLRSRAEFEASGANDDASVWARFTDGRFLIIADNRPAADSIFPGESGGTNLDNPGVPRKELPKEGTARLMNAMGTHFINTGSALSAMLSAGGYNVSRPAATIENLEAVQGDGVFYLDSHGGQATLSDGTTTYGVWTSTVWDTTAERTYRELWDAKQIGYFTAKMNDIPGHRDTATVETHIAITAEFVSNQMSFGTNCLIYIDACSALGSAARSFQNACIISSIGGTGAYAGWTNTIWDRQAADVAYFVIDRLLGTNQDFRHRENPRQRPFTYPEILTELSNRHPPLDVYTDPATGIVANFLIVPTSPQFGILAPSIEFLDVDEENHRLQIFGEFGSDQSTGSVTINGQALAIQNWSTNEIDCAINSSGPNSSGEVKVIARQHESNPVMLTEWRPHITVVSRTRFGTISDSLTFNIHVRGDVHSYRRHPGEDPQPRTSYGISGVDDSQGSYTAGGVAEHTDPVGGCDFWERETWVNREQDSIQLASGGREFIGVVADLHPQDRTLKLYLTLHADSAIQATYAETTYCSGYPPFGAEIPNLFGPIAQLDTLDLHFDQSFNILPMPSIQKPYGPPLVGWGWYTIPDIEGTTTMTFSGATAIHPPDPNAPQRPVMHHDVDYSMLGSKSRRF